MRIVIDMQGAQCGSRHRGIGRYTLALARAMVLLGRTKHEFILALNGLFPESIEPIRGAFEGLVSQNQIKVWSAVGPVRSQDRDNDWRRLTAEALRESFIASLRPDVVHITSLMEGFDDNAVHSIGRFTGAWGTAVTFYDVIPLIQSDIYLAPHPIFAPVYREKIDHLKRADMLLAISESSRQEAIQHLFFDPAQVVDIAAAADECFRPLNVSREVEVHLRRKLKLDRPFIMYSGATDERKNHLRLIQAYGRLPRNLRSKFQLALVGRIPPPHQQKFEQCIQACGLSLQDVVITGGVTDDELTQLYNLCHIFVFPSWHEGFGLPALEAMACGAAVIGSNRTSVPEVIGRTDALFDPLDTDSITEKLQQVLEDEDFRVELKNHALVQAGKFSWEKSAKIALSHFESWFEEQSRSGNSAVLPAPTRTEEIARLMSSLASAPTQPASELELIRVASAIASNLPTLRNRRLFIDVSELVHRDSRSGIQRVVRSVLKQLLSHPPAGFDVAPVWIRDHLPGYFHAKQFVSKFLGLPVFDVLEESIDDAQSGDVFLGLDFQPYLVASQKEYFQNLRRRGVQISFVLYDLLPILKPTAFPIEWDQSRIHTDWLDLLARSDGVICISQAVADEFTQWLEFFGPARDRALNIGWFHLGADLGGSLPTTGEPLKADELREAWRSRFGFLSVGTLEPRKGIADLIKAAEDLWSEGLDFNVIIVGKKGWNVDALSKLIEFHPENSQRLFWLSAASDEFLDDIYDLADCLVAASEAEGFGLPLVEAALHGLPVIARDIPVFREVATGAVRFFNGQANDSLSQCMRLQLKEVRTPAAVRIRWPVKTWEDSTDQLINVLLGRHWDRSWMPHPKTIRLWAGGDQFITEIGSRKNLEVFVEPGQQGCALHGPYLQLNAGAYELVVRGRQLGDILEGVSVDVALDQGRRILAEGKISSPTSLMSREIARLRFVLADNCTDLETRVWVRGSADFALTLIELRPIPLSRQDGNVTTASIESY